MVKKIFLVLIPLIIGFAATAAIYVLFVKQHAAAPTSASSLTKFSIEKPPSASLIGNITSLSGNVFWLSRTTNSPIAITQPRHIQQGEELQTQNGTVTVKFTKVATVRLAKNVHISIIQTLPVDIVFQQTQGTVTYTASGLLPVSVRGLDLLMSTRKGAYTVSVDPKKKLVTVAVIDGSLVVAFTDTNNITQEITLSQGKKLTFHNDTKVIKD